MVAIALETFISDLFQSDWSLLHTLKVSCIATKVSKCSCELVMRYARLWDSRFCHKSKCDKRLCTDMA